MENRCWQTALMATNTDNKRPPQWLALHFPHLADQTGLERLAAWCYQYSSQVCIARQHNGLLLEVAASQRLFGNTETLARRLHTEPYVWDREDITAFCRERAAEFAENPNPAANNDWKKEREYLDIRVEGNIAYDAFTTDRFKAMHIWEKQKDGSWKILFDVGFLHQTEDSAGEK